MASLPCFRLPGGVGLDGGSPWGPQFLAGTLPYRPEPPRGQRQTRGRERQQPRGGCAKSAAGPEDEGGYRGEDPSRRTARAEARTCAAYLHAFSFFTLLAAEE